MLHIHADAIICTVRPHGEHGAVVRCLTREHGLIAGYVRGAKSRGLRPVLLPANMVAVEARGRTAEQLPSLAVDLIVSRAPFHNEPLAAAAFGWICLLTGQVLPEQAAYPRLYDACTAVLDAVSVAPSARGWAAGLVRYELLLLSELGFGLDLSQCVVTGSEADLTHVSPKSGGAVSAGAAEGYKTRLLPLPPFLLDNSVPEWPDIFDGLMLTGHFLTRSFFSETKLDYLAARDLMVDRMKRAIA